MILLGIVLNFSMVGLLLKNSNFIVLCPILCWPRGCSVPALLSFLGFYCLVWVSFLSRGGKSWFFLIVITSLSCGDSG
jgi:hypothetical protein